MINHNLNHCLKEDNAYHTNYTEVKNLYKFINYMKIDELKEVKGLSERRRDTIKSGIIILLLYLEKINCEKIIISKTGIREGILKEYLEKNLEL
jgi:exopolyphosphatase/guanosine-5'-triphosphate,3'-diphosphate pyrophosphatase